MPGNPAPQPINAIAEKLGLASADVEPRGWFQAKLASDIEQRLADRPSGRYVNVTAINPTPLGEGKTVVSIGLAMAMCRLGHLAVPTLRQPSLAPVFGIKGGGAGAGRASLLPAEEINLHFTGDLHAIAAAHNLLAAMIDNHAARRLEPRIEPSSIIWRRVIDSSDKGLAHVVTGLDRPRQALLRETGFDLTAASEVMAILALASDLGDLRARLARIVVGIGPDGAPVSAEQIGAAGAMAVLLRDALRPNLVQTCEHTPAFVHTGPFGNIAHGNSSIIGDRVALRLADYVITESGFGADCGAEKFFDIKCRVSGLRPDVSVVVCTVRALKLQSGRFRVVPGRPLPAELLAEDLESLRAGTDNLRAHVEIVRRFGVPAVVAINRFPDDSPRELEELRRIAADTGAADAAVVDVFSRGSDGGLELAEAVIRACETPNQFAMLYSTEMTPLEKLTRIAEQIYGADGVTVEPAARRALDEFTRQGFGHLPICIAKTQYSLSHDPQGYGRPRGFRLPIREARLAAGAGFLYVLAGDVMTMPGLPRIPAATRMDIDARGEVTGL
ncbi:MAG: formate--tetrahydrofolate ligase [Planctomycetaceae bacterium]|nr:formate--tetrahydrofolate ligase [Planctomycetaceae bacterium]